MGRRFLVQRRLEFVHAPGEFIAAVLELAQLPVELRTIADKLLNSGPQRLVLLHRQIVLIVQVRALLFDFLQTFLLRRELRPERRQLFAYRMQPAPVVFQFPLGPLELRASVRERGAGFRGRCLGGANRFFQILDAPRQLFMLGGEPIAFNREAGMIAPQALVHAGQSLELSFGLEVSDFRALDFDQGLVNRRERIVKLRADSFDISKRMLDRIQLSP